MAFHYGKLLTYENVLDVLGAVDSGVFSSMFNAVIEGRTKDCITQLEEIVIQGRDGFYLVSEKSAAGTERR